MGQSFCLFLLFCFPLSVLMATSLPLPPSAEANATAKSDSSFLSSELALNSSRCDDTVGDNSSSQQCCKQAAPLFEITKLGTFCKVPCIVGLKGPALGHSTSIFVLFDSMGDVVCCVEVKMGFSKIRVRIQNDYLKKKCVGINHVKVLSVPPCEWYYFKTATDGRNSSTLSLVGRWCEFHLSDRMNAGTGTQPIRLLVMQGRSYTLIQDVSKPLCSAYQAKSTAEGTTETPDTKKTEEDTALTISLTVTIAATIVLLISGCSVALYKGIKERHRSEETSSPGDNPHIAITINSASTSDVCRQQQQQHPHTEGCPDLLSPSDDLDHYPPPPPPIATAPFPPLRLPGQLTPPTPPERTISLRKLH